MISLRVRENFCTYCLVLLLMVSGLQTSQAVCGDAAVEDNEGEACDDGNLITGDGCSSECTIECGWTCETAQVLVPSNEVLVPPSNVTGSTNGTNETAGNVTQTGTPAPTYLPGRSKCSSECGDGVVVGNETCDDGNREEEDGCSSNCEPEQFWTCNTAASCAATECVQTPPWLVVEQKPCADGHCVAGDQVSMQFRVYGLGVTEASLAIILICEPNSGCSQDWLVGPKQVDMSLVTQGDVALWDATAPSRFWNPYFSKASSSLKLRYDVRTSLNVLTAESVVFEVRAGAPTKLIILNQPPSSIRVQRLLHVNPSVRVQDRFGNDVPDLTVTARPVALSTDLDLPDGEDPVHPYLEGQLTQVTSLVPPVIFRELSFSVPGEWRIEFSISEPVTIKNSTEMIVVTEVEDKPEWTFLMEQSYSASWETLRGPELLASLVSICDIDAHFFTLVESGMWRNESFSWARIIVHVHKSSVARRQLLLATIEEAIRNDFALSRNSILQSRMNAIGANLHLGRPLGVPFSPGDMGPVVDPFDLEIDVDSVVVFISVVSGLAIFIGGASSLVLSWLLCDQPFDVIKSSFTRFGYLAAMNVMFETQLLALLGFVGGYTAAVQDLNALSHKMAWAIFDWEIIPRDILAEPNITARGEIILEDCSDSAGNAIVHHFLVCVVVIGICFVVRETLKWVALGVGCPRTPDMLMFPAWEGPCMMAQLNGLFFTAARTIAQGCVGWIFLAIILGYIGPMAICTVAALMLRSQRSYRYLESGDPQKTVTDVMEMVMEREHSSTYMESVLKTARDLYAWLNPHDMRQVDELIDMEDKPLFLFGFLFKDYCKRGWGFFMGTFAATLLYTTGLAIHDKDISAATCVIIFILRGVLITLVRPYADPARNAMCIFIEYMNGMAVVCAAIAIISRSDRDVLHGSKAAVAFAILAWIIAIMDALLSSFRGAKHYVRYRFALAEREQITIEDTAEAAFQSQIEVQRTRSVGNTVRGSVPSKQEQRSEAPSRQLDGFSMSSAPLSQPSDSPRGNKGEIYDEAEITAKRGSVVLAESKERAEYVHRSVNELRHEYTYKDRHDTVGRVNVYAQVMHSVETQVANSLQPSAESRHVSSSPALSGNHAPSPAGLSSDIGFATRSSVNTNATARKRVAC